MSLRGGEADAAILWCCDGGHKDDGIAALAMTKLLRGERAPGDRCGYCCPSAWRRPKPRHSAGSARVSNMPIAGNPLLARLSSHRLQRPDWWARLSSHCHTTKKCNTRAITRPCHCEEAKPTRQSCGVATVVTRTTGLLRCARNDKNPCHCEEAKPTRQSCGIATAVTRTTGLLRSQ